MLPLTPRDRKALEEIFEKVGVEEIYEIEEVKLFYSVAPLEPWEEQGWVLNSAFKIDGEPFVMDK